MAFSRFPLHTPGWGGICTCCTLAHIELTLVLFNCANDAVPSSAMQIKKNLVILYIGSDNDYYTQSDIRAESQVVPEWHSTCLFRKGCLHSHHTQATFRTTPLLWSFHTINHYFLAYQSKVRWCDTIHTITQLNNTYNSSLMFYLN